MNITPFPDDSGTEELKRLNRDAPVKQTDKVAPYPAIPASQRKLERQPGIVGVEMRRGERRREERRKEQRSVLLDTRDQHERRTHHDRRDEPEEQRPPGLDETV